MPFIAHFIFAARECAERLRDISLCAPKTDLKRSSDSIARTLFAREDNVQTSSGVTNVNNSACKTLPRTWQSSCLCNIYIAEEPACVCTDSIREIDPSLAHRAAELPLFLFSNISGACDRVVVAEKQDRR